MANILICTTGGTIASSAKDPVNATHYELGGIVGDDLIASVPGISDLATLQTEKIFDVVSGDIDGEMLLQLARTVEARLGDEAVDGVVITHGTDTMEETAFFLDLTTQPPASQSSSPVPCGHHPPSARMVRAISCRPWLWRRIPMPGRAAS